MSEAMFVAPSVVRRNHLDRPMTQQHGHGPTNDDCAGALGVFTKSAKKCGCRDGVRSTTPSSGKNEVAAKRD
jgi:hypothetical protein